MSNSFKEAKLGPKFCREDIKKIRQLIENSTTFSVCGMPSMGISIFLRFLATQKFAYFVHVDINELPKLSRSELFKLLRKQLRHPLEELAQKHRRIVIIFNRFDRLKKEFNEDFFSNLRSLRDIDKEKIVMVFAANRPLLEQSFFSNLRSLRDIDKEKIVMVFAANRPLLEQSPKALSGGNLNMYSKTFYLKPYSKEDLKKLTGLNAPKFLKHQDFDRALELSGGHYQLLQLLLKSDCLHENPLQDKAIKFQLKDLYKYLKYPQRKLLQKTALGKKVKTPEKYLLDTGFVKKTGGKLEVFTTLLADFIKSGARVRLPFQESRLFALLKSRAGKTVTKDEIFEALWKNGEGSDWALNALIYRIRKNPAFVSLGYIIENQKKSGYSLIRN
ncbi:helix-turn-helix domain-containing protein [Candidatus Daviesbacteria bacterium]|nr:helix-turn-helix domain-containing protein [Candidatus Daviesbacteria bacterium]